MSKNIVVFSDGTGQDGGVRAEQRMSNVYKLYRASRVGPESPVNSAAQVSFYDPGLGTETTATGMTDIVRRVQKLLASVSGTGITTNIADCYEFIINHYQAGDRIFLFGFSRGAYTVRAVANLLMLCGVPSRVGDAPLPRFRKATRDIAEEAVRTVLEHGAGHLRKDFEDERLELARRFRENYGSHHETGEVNRSNTAPHFIGVFDTVAALGAKGLRRSIIQIGLYAGVFGLGAVAAFVPALIVAAIASFWVSFWGTFGSIVVAGAALGMAVLHQRQRGSVRKTIRDFPNPGDVHSHIAEWKGDNFDRLLSRFVNFARSANAIDETREDFARVGWGPTVAAPTTIDGHEVLKQLWFAGNHSDIGGSYPEAESRLSDIALLWMIEEATAIPDGLVVGPVVVKGERFERSMETGAALHLFPSADGLQHCEVAGMQDMIASRTPTWLSLLSAKLGYKVKLRDINPEAVVHPTVEARFEFADVPQCAGFGPYRPQALRNHKKFAHFYLEEATPI
ncbi:DUF2235 domain-containing protein [Mesorhizobium sp. M0019]|uniref:DUF2235 domain-containing protein n=1 Tax=unclassified Mesorhizobium TaxID=325217 RepID=UPI00333A5367